MPSLADKMRQRLKGKKPLPTKAKRVLTARDFSARDKQLLRETTQRQIMNALGRKSLAAFFKHGWSAIETSKKLEWNWHHQAVCDHLQAMLEDWMRHEKDPSYQQRFTRFLVNIPPGTAKSRMVSVYMPAWMWLHWPSWKAAFLSANPKVAQRDSLYRKQLLNSDWYQKNFAPEWKFSRQQNAKNEYWNDKGGQMRAFGWNAQIIGDRFDALVWDDPHDPEKVQSDKILESALERWDSTISSRINDLEFSLMIGIMQRVRENDMSGHVLKEGDWEHLCLPLFYEPERVQDIPDLSRQEIKRVSAIGWSDPRTERGDVLHPVRFSPKAIAREEAKGSYRFAGQFQQRPAPSEGGIFKRVWWRFWVLPEYSHLDPIQTRKTDGEMHEHPQVVLPTAFDFMCQSWDLAFDGKSSGVTAQRSSGNKKLSNANNCGEVWALKGANRFLLDEVCKQMGFTQTQAEFRRLSAKWPRAHSKYVENKANGPAIINSLRDEIDGILAIDPEGDKVARARAEEGTVEAGNVYLPHPDMPGYAWVWDYILEFATFPNGMKDRVDTTSQALMRIRKWLRNGQQEEAESTSEFTG